MIEKFINKRVASMEPYVAGLTREEVAKRHGLKPSDVIKLASNENPYGPSPRAVEAVKNHSREVSLYPADLPYDLLGAISRYINVPVKMIIPGGNGADEVMDMVIKLLVSPADEVVIHPPTFPYYRILIGLYGGKAVEAPLNEDLSFSIESFQGRVSEKTKLIIICSPNNPTGSVISRSELIEILSLGLPVMLDEAYVEFAEESLVDLVSDHDNLIVLRTFSKAFGLAGLRVGYGVASEHLSSEALKIKPPHNVNLLAQKAAVAALEDLPYMRQTVEKIKALRAEMFNELKQIGDIVVYPSQANFLLISLKDRKAADVVLDLEKKGIIVRDCRSFGIEDSIRVSVGRREENQKFISAFKDALR